MITPDDLSKLQFIDEREQVAALLQNMDAYAHHTESAFHRASRYVEEIRAEGPRFGMEQFIQQFGLDTQEGVLLMGLAEALLRIPDARTADELIDSALREAKFEQYLKSSRTLRTQASIWGLKLSSEWIKLGGKEGEEGNPVGSLLSRLGEPVIRTALKSAMRFLGSQFVLGGSLKEALANAEEWHEQGYQFSFDVLGEGARTEKQAEHYVAGYREAIRQVAARTFDGSSLTTTPNISIKLSALHPRYLLTHRKQMLPALLSRLIPLLAEARKLGIWVSLDAEESFRLDLQLEVYRALLNSAELKGYEGIGFVLQAYQKRSLAVLHSLGELAANHKIRIPVRLVKGAYWDSEIKNAQVMGLPNYPVFTRKSHTDISYLACAHQMLSDSHFYPQFATHNALTAAQILELTSEKKFASRPYEFQKLFGMGDGLFRQLIQEAPCRIYAPVGPFQELLPYLIRRLLENGANSSFVNQLMNPDVEMILLLRDPIKKSQQNQEKVEPKIPLPADIFLPARTNSPGYSLGNREHLNALSEAIQKAPAALSKPMKDTSPSAIPELFSEAQSAFTEWESTPAEQRASMIDSVASLLIRERDALLSLLVHEGKKTLYHALIEWREAIDYCTYYAQECRNKFGTPITLPSPTGESNQLFLRGRGVFVCISPWNFPLAIYLGQVLAALAAGNTVIAKPAEQTPHTAAFALKLMHKAGIPKSAIQNVYGLGEKVGPVLLKNEALAGVAFTGSVATAQLINRALAARVGAIVPLIAETGGMNCMIVDSTALLEQTVDDILESAFGYAGQRCSALRVVFVQNEIADKLLSLLGDAVHELRVGMPQESDTDVSPVIDAEAKTTLQSHLVYLESCATKIAEASLADGLDAQADFVAPSVWEIPNLTILKEEVFGPVLHVIRFDAAELSTLIADINATGYGLTFGLQSRIRERIEQICPQIHAGNIYVNRSTTGAVVGVQPFGGEGLSGTGFKAGGPHYLLRFATERTLTNNLTAIGGNIQLLS